MFYNETIAPFLNLLPFLVIWESDAQDLLSFLKALTLKRNENQRLLLPAQRDMHTQLHSDPSAGEFAIHPAWVSIYRGCPWVSMDPRGGWWIPDPFLLDGYL